MLEVVDVEAFPDMISPEQRGPRVDDPGWARRTVIAERWNLVANSLTSGLG